jgi:hypothetical protein
LSGLGVRFWTKLIVLNTLEVKILKIKILFRGSQGGVGGGVLPEVDALIQRIEILGK